MGIVLVAFLAARASIVEGREQYFNFESDQLVSQGGKPVELIISVPILDSYVFALNIAEFTELWSGIARARGLMSDGLRATQS